MNSRMAMDRFMGATLFSFTVACLCLVGTAQICGEEKAQEAVINGKPLAMLIKDMKGKNRGRQVRAARAIAEAPEALHEQIIPSLIPLLRSTRENDRFVAAQALGEYGPKARVAVPDLLPLLKGQQYERNRAAAAKALGQILQDAQPGKEIDVVVEALTKKFNEEYDNYPDVRREAVRALGMIGPAAKSCIPKLLKGLTDFKKYSSDHFSVRMAAAWTAGRMGPASAVHMDRLLSMLHSESDIATAVVWAIGEIGPVHKNVILNLMDRLEKALAGSGFRVGAIGFPIGDIPKGTIREYMDQCFAVLVKFGTKSKVAVPLMTHCISKGQWYARHRISNAIGAFKVLRAVGPEAKEAIPALEKAVKVTRFDQRIPKGIVKDFKLEARAALAAVSGRPLSSSENVLTQKKK